MLCWLAAQGHTALAQQTEPASPWSGVSLAAVATPGGATADKLSLMLQPSTARPLAPTGQPAALDLAVRWQSPSSMGHKVDVLAWRRLTPVPTGAAPGLEDAGSPEYGARIEMLIASARARPANDAIFLGMKLDNGGRIMLRRKNGNPTVYYRVQF
ncbi:MAG TPA: hypothetical protein VLJ86_24750 [Ramlibacter sp.]|nr:hypothetical protein [Ramlibacter sp.]